MTWDSDMVAVAVLTFGYLLFASWLPRVGTAIGKVRTLA